MPSLKKIISLVILYSSFTLVVFSQVDIDSLKDKLNNFPNDSSGIHKILVISSEYSNLDLNANIACLEVAEQKALIVNDAKLLCEIYLKMGGTYIELSKSVEASYYISKGKYLAEHIHNTGLLIKMHRVLGLLYYTNKEFTIALKEYQTIVSMAEKPEYLVHKEAALINIAGIYYQMNIRNGDKLLLEEGLNYLKQAIVIAKQRNDTHQQFDQYCNLSLLYIEMNVLDSAEHYLKEANNIMSDTSNIEMEMVYYSNLSNLYFHKKAYEKAIHFMNLSIGYAEQLGIPEWIYTSYGALANIYLEQNDYKNAFKYYQQSVLLKDSVISQENFVKAADIQNQYEREKQKKEVLRLNKDNEINLIQLELINNKRNKAILLLLILGVVLLILSALLLLLLKNIRSRRKAFVALQIKSALIAEQSLELNQQSKLIAKFQSQMNPHFVFNALHNIQGLVMTSENTKATSQIQSLSQLMRKTFSNAEKDVISLEIEIAYLEKYMEFEMNTFDNRITFDIVIDPQVENVLIPPMMIQPFIENAIKHAKLQKVVNPYIKIEIGIENNLLGISIRDNGIGIKKDVNDLDKLSHSMSIVKSRIQLLFQNDTELIKPTLFTLKTIPEIDSGTLVKFYLPLHFAY